MKEIVKERLRIFKSRKRILIILLVFCIGGAGAYYGLSKDTAPEEQRAEVPVAKGDIKTEVTANGTASLETVELTFQVGGILEEIPVAVGEKVSAGDVIARLEAEDYNLEVQSARANYEAAVVKLDEARYSHDSAVREAEEQLETAGTQYKPMQEAPELFPEQEIALQRIAVEKAKADYERAVADSANIKSAEISIRQAQIALQQAEENAADTVLRSPVAGTVLYIAGEVGEKVTANTDSETAFAVVCVGDAVSVTAQVNELDIPGIMLGQAAEVQFEAVPNEVFTGKVRGIELMPAESGSGIVTYDVRVLLDEPSDKIKNGMTASVSIITDKKEDVLILPQDAVISAGDMTLVEVVSSTGETKRQRVKTGISDGTNIEIVEGLKEGDVVALSVGSSPVSAASERARDEDRFIPAGGLPPGGQIRIRGQ